MKQKDKVIEQMATDQRKLFDRLDNLETSQQERETGSQLDMLRTAEREALEVGDTTKAQELRDQITDLKIQSAQPKPKEEPKPIEVDFTAHQKYGSCGEDIPYDVFHGTARPGTKIWIESAHGSATVKANEKGKWEAKVKFKTSEPGVPFPVVIETSDGDRAEFTFVNTGGGEH